MKRRRESVDVVVKSRSFSKGRDEEEKHKMTKRDKTMYVRIEILGLNSTFMQN